MATSTRAKPIKQKRRVVKGIEHGVIGSYTNHGCRCPKCTAANARHSAIYRARRFAGQPLCIWGKCKHRQSRSYGNGLCWKHARRLIELRETNPKLARKAERLLGLEPSNGNGKAS